jgi:hypothetical protein
MKLAEIGIDRLTREFRVPVSRISDAVNLRVVGAAWLEPVQGLLDQYRPLPSYETFDNRVFT